MMVSAMGLSVKPAPSTYEAGLLFKQSGSKKQRWTPSHAVQEMFAEWFGERGISPAMRVVRTNCLFCDDTHNSMTVDFGLCSFMCSKCRVGGNLWAAQDVETASAIRKRAAFIAQGGIEPRRGIKDANRDEEVKLGIEMMLNSRSPIEENGWERDGESLHRARSSLQKTIAGYDRCLKRVQYQRYTHSQHGNSYQAKAGVPCGQYAHDSCSWYHFISKDEMGKWTECFSKHYPSPPSVLEFYSMDEGYEAVKKAAMALKKSPKLSKLFTATVGVITPTPRGYSFFLLARAADLTMKASAEAEWTSLVGPGCGVRERPVLKGASAFELAVELRVQSDQALPLAVARGQLDAYQALLMRAEEIGTTAGGGGNKLLFGPGFRVRTRDTFSDNSAIELQEENISENVTMSEPCKVCGDPECRQYAQKEFVHWQHLERKRRRGRVKALTPDIYMATEDAARIRPHRDDSARWRARLSALRSSRKSTEH